jgi:hypothetical protein
MKRINLSMPCPRGTKMMLMLAAGATLIGTIVGAYVVYENWFLAIAYMMVLLPWLGRTLNTPKY